MTVVQEAGSVVGRDRAVRRNTSLLAIALAFFQAAFPVFLVVGGPVAKDMTGRSGSIGILSMIYFASGALSAVLIGRWMDRAGRRPGLLFAAGALALAGVGSAIAVAVASFPLLLLSAVPYGVAQGGANLTRGAVADMYAPDARGKAIGKILAAGTIGAVGGPLLVAVLDRLGSDLEGVPPHVVPWGLVLVSAAMAAAFLVRLRPDPRSLAWVAEGDRAERSLRAPRALLEAPAYRLALVAAAIGQMAMVSVMGVTPTALHDHGDGATVISLVISVHITGMFAFAPFVGMAIDRYGRRFGLVTGFVITTVGALIAGSDASAWAVGAGLFAIGLGWSATYLGATAIVSDITQPDERGGALGFIDLVVGVTSAVASFGAAFLFEGFGFRTLGVVIASLMLVAIVSVLRWKVTAHAHPPAGTGGGGS